MIAWLAIATAADHSPVEVDVRATVGVGARSDIPTLLGGGASVAYVPWTRFRLELGVDGGARTTGGAWVGAGPRARVYLGPPELPALSVFAGGGLAIEAGTPGFVSLGAAMEPLKSPGPRPRLQFDFIASPGSESRGLLSVGAVFGRRGPRAIEPTMEVAGYEPVEFDGMVWVPGPVCQWLSEPDANAALSNLDMQLASLNVVNDLTMRGGQPSDGATPPRLVVATSPSNEVTVNGEPLEIVDGVGSGTWPEGPLDVQIIGGGRMVVWPVALAEGNVVWVTPEPPGAERVGFEMGSASLDLMAQVQIESVAEFAGGWSFEVVGSASPEGDATANTRLARARSKAVADALVRAGLPRDRVTVGEPRHYAELSVDEQRAAFIEPREPR